MIGLYGLMARLTRPRPAVVVEHPEPDMPSPCCGRGGFLHHIEDDE